VEEIYGKSTLGT